MSSLIAAVCRFSASSWRESEAITSRERQASISRETAASVDAKAVFFMASPTTFTPSANTRSPSKRASVLLVFVQFSNTNMYHEHKQLYIPPSIHSPFVFLRLPRCKSAERESSSFETMLSASPSSSRTVVRLQRGVFCMSGFGLQCSSMRSRQGGGADVDVETLPVVRFSQ